VKRATVVLLTLLVSVLTWDASAATGPTPSASSPAPSPPWLRPAAPSKAATQTPAAPSSSGFSFGKYAALLLVVGLGGYALYAKKKRAAQNPLKGSGGLRVIESARLGPKAALVTAVVGRRVILLGVTEQSVSKLGWLTPAPPGESDDAEEDAASDDEPAAELDQASEPPSAAPVRPVPARNEPPRGKTRPSDGSFASRLRSALGTTAPATTDDALATSAQLTRDVVDVGRSRRRARTPNKDAARSGAGAGSGADEAMIDVEAQAAGLIRRLKGKNQ
jgi:flagellar biogenesis protein FliO